MKLAVFVSDFKLTTDTLDRMKAEKLGIILVQNGVYHATTKESLCIVRGRADQGHERRRR
jgi:sulfur transfer complex TusBCD TusB component (DsrH family)